ncbi:MAG TPA: AI-2E family transporter [Solimonas sp.]|nr:AI-2E family transporter [Solimonas sp.]
MNLPSPGSPLDPLSAPPPPRNLQRNDLLAWAAAGLILLLILKLHLLPALLAGLLVHELVNVLTPWFKHRALGRDGPRLIAVALIASAVIAALAAAGVGIAAFLRSSDESLPALLARMAQIIENSREHLPAWLLAYLPDDAETLRLAVVEWLRTHAGTLQIAGRDLGRALAHILLGMIIGALLSLQRANKSQRRRPLTVQVGARAARMASAFRRVVFAQFWISSINTFFTWLYLGVVLPQFGVELPLMKTLVLVTFVAGLLPILGNLISNSVIFVVSLSQGLFVALGALAYLIVIHKLEYFLNARIIGANIKARASELLIAMLVMEAAFGIPGLIAAPIFYAYFKDELKAKGLV